MGDFFEVKDIRRFILESNTWQEFTTNLQKEDKKTKGDAFELLSMCYLKTNPFYGSIFKEIYHQSEVSVQIKVEKLKLAKNDIGVDLIALDFDGDYWAIQCKYRSLITRNLRLNDRLAEFFSMTGGQKLKKELKNRILITTTNDISKKIKDNFKDFSQILNNSFSELNDADFSKFKKYLGKRYENLKIKKNLKKLEYQRKAIRKVVAEFKKEEKGQLIMACGSGKTLTALQIKEKMNIKSALYLLPSLNLINQTIKEWVSFSKIYFKPLCVCSDPSSAKIIDKKDRWIFSKEDIGIPVLNSSEKIIQYLNDEKKYVIFCTYQSSKLILNAQSEGLLQEFDITFCDEAHNCAGNGFKRSGLILNKNKIKSKKRLFMTATPLNIDQKIKENAYKKNIEVSSMDDFDKFGKVFHTLSFREAVTKKILVPYKIIFQDIKKSETVVIEKILKRKLVRIPEIDYIDSESIACDIALIKGMKKFGIKKVITFHRLVKFAEYFSKTFKYVWDWMDTKDKTISQPECFWLSGEFHSQQERQTILNRFKYLKEFESLIVSNSQCLSEGVNVPSLDGICFVDPKRSTTDIIQSVGRVMRTSPGKSTGYIIIPIFINDIDEIDEELSATRFKYIWQIIRALMRHDEYLAERIKYLRIELGQRRKATRDRKGLELPKELVLPEELSNSFADSIEVTLIRELTENWFEMYGKLKHFLLTNEGRQPTRDDGLTLYNWCSTQRINFRNKSKLLTKERQSLLNDLIPIGWQWEILEDNWMNNYKELEIYLDELNGKPLILYDMPKKLSDWTSRQISNFDNLNDDRKTLLQKLQTKGLRIEKKRIVNQRLWIEKIEEFYDQNQHLVIPAKGELGNIVQMIRGGYKGENAINLTKETIESLKNFEEKGWMYDPTIEISFEKIKLLKEWCFKNNSLNPKRGLFIKGNNKTYANHSKKTESEKREFNLGVFVNSLKTRYRYKKFFLDPNYKIDFDNIEDWKEREISEEEIKEIESIKTKDGNFWFWESFDGFVRVYKECFERNIKIKNNTTADFDLPEFRNIGRWIKTVHTAYRNNTLKKYNFEKLKRLPGTHFEAILNRVNARYN